MTHIVTRTMDRIERTFIRFKLAEQSDDGESELTNRGAGSIVLLGLVAVGSLVFFGAERFRTPVTTAQIKTAISADGFTASSGIDAEYDHGVRIYSLVLDNCDFHNVEARWYRDKQGNVTVDGYKAPIGQVGDGAAQTSSLDLHFETAEELKADLPALKCN